MRITSLLEAQREELIDLKAYGEGRGLPTLRASPRAHAGRKADARPGTLRDIYVKLQSGLQGVRAMRAAEADETLVTLVQVLQEGPAFSPPPTR